MVKRIGMLMGALLMGVLSAALAIGLLGSAPVQAGPADEVTTPQLIVFASGSQSYTQTFTTTARYIGGRTLMQVFGNLDVGSAQTVSVKIQTSPDGVRLWGTYTTVMNAVAVDTALTPGQINAVGAYARVVVEAGTTAAFTPELRLLLK